MEDVVYAPMNGRIVMLEMVPDPTFSQKMMGEGVAIEPSDGEVVAPFDGEVIQVFPTKHAIGLKSKVGAEVLIHIGIDTVKLGGEGFEAHVRHGDKVKVGDLLVTFDLDFIKKNAPSAITPMVITNSAEIGHTVQSCEDTVVAGKTILFNMFKKDSEGQAETGEKAQSSEDKANVAGDSNPPRTEGNTSANPKQDGEKGLQYRKEAREIVEAIGGADNINAATHCVTRLRFALADEGKVDEAALEKINVVKGSFSANGQYQVVIGQGTVDKVYAAMVKETGIGEATKEQVKAESAKKQNALQRGIKVLADIFIPILPAIVTAGLLMGINNILANPGIFAEQSIVEMYPSWAGLADMINIIANTAFTFLPGLIGWSAVKRFGGNELLGVVLGLILVHPDLLNAWAYGDALEKGMIPTWNLFGWEVNKIGYQGQVLPVLFASWLLAKLEIWLKQRVHDSLQLLVVAPVALLVTGFLTFIIIGPITFAIGNWITDGLVALFNSFALIGGLLYGAIYAPLVITGMHHTFLAVDLQLIGSTGSTFLWPILALSNIAQGSAALAMMFASKNEKLKGLALTSWISAWLGITEPAMFGVNLRFRYPFISAIIGSAIAAAFITVQQVKASSVGVGGVPGILSIIPGGWTSFAIGMAIVMIVPFVLTYSLAVRKRKEEI